MKSIVKIRSIKPKDAKSVCELIDTAFPMRKEKLGFSINKYKIFFLIMGLIDPVLECLGFKFMKIFIAEIDGKIAGSASTLCIDRGVWLQSNMNVHPDFRGKGIGKFLYKARIQYNIKRKAKYVSGEVRHDNETAIHIWRKKMDVPWLRRSNIYLFDPKQFKGKFLYSNLNVKEIKNKIPENILNNDDIQQQIIKSEKSIHTTFIQSILSGIIPPVTYSTHYIENESTLKAFARIRTYYPAKIIFVDYIWYCDQIEKSILEQFVRFLLNYACKSTNKKVWFYVGEGRELLNQIVKAFHVPQYSSSYYFCYPPQDIQLS